MPATWLQQPTCRAACRMVNAQVVNGRVDAAGMALPVPVMTLTDHLLQEARGWQQQGPPPQQQAHQPGRLQAWPGREGACTGRAAGGRGLGVHALCKQQLPGKVYVTVQTAAAW